MSETLLKYGFIVEFSNPQKLEGVQELDGHPGFVALVKTNKLTRHREIELDFLRRNKAVLDRCGYKYSDDQEPVDFMVFEVGALKLGNRLAGDRIVTYCHDTRTPKKARLIEKYRNEHFKIDVM